MLSSKECTKCIMSHIQNTITNRRSKGYTFLGQNLFVVNSLFSFAPVVCSGYMFVLFLLCTVNCPITCCYLVAEEEMVGCFTLCVFRLSYPC